MDKKSLESVFGAHLIAQGFKRKASTWYRQAEGALHVIDLQKSNYGMQFYVNLCCVPLGMEIEGMPTPKEHKCPIRVRLTSMAPGQKPLIEKAFDLEADSLSEDERTKAITKVVCEVILPFMSQLKDASSIREIIRGGELKTAWVNLAAQRYLGIAA
jgi:hypothetical protein